MTAARHLQPTAYAPTLRAIARAVDRSTFNPNRPDSFPLLRDGWRKRQRYDELTARPRAFASCFDASAVQRNDLAHDAQADAQTRPLVRPHL